MPALKTISFIGLASALSLSAQYLRPAPAFAVRAEHSAPPMVEDKHAAEVDPSIVAVEVARSDASADNYMNPSSRSWTSIAPSVVPLFPQAISSPAGGGSTAEVSVKAAEVAEGMVFRFEWIDATQDDGRKGGNFKDAVAIEFPIDEAGETRLAMGHSGGPVNILYWSADPGKLKGSGRPKQAIELVSAGIYSRTPKPDSMQKLQSWGTWRNKKWTVVIFKPTNQDDKEAPKFGPGTDIPVAFAVWNGSAGERLGLKSVSNWNVLHCK